MSLAHLLIARRQGKNLFAELFGWGAITFALAGCASPGPPQPPSLHLPGMATGLKAERVGDRMIVSWSTPANTTDGESLREPVTAVLCRQAATEKSSSSPLCQPVQRASIPAGPSQLSEELPATLTSGQPSLIGYRVELQNGRGRSAGLSAPIFAAAGAAPPAVAGLKLEAQRDGALATWKLQPSEALVELRRTTLVTAQTTEPGAASQRTKSQPPPPGRLAARALSGDHAVPGTARDTPRFVILRAERDAATASLTTDAGGVLDRSVRDLESYSYVAQRVRRVSLQGHELELRSEPSAPVTFSFRNVFPPHAPVGLTSAPNGGFGAALSIDLSWEPGTENDVIGYFVYRQIDRGGFVRLNPQPLEQPSFHDAAVQAGHLYAYRVTAIDERKNESKPSAEARETLRP